MLLRLPTSINCNAILYGLPKVLLNRLQLVQNRAARIVTFTKQHEYITSSLTHLHWLPVEYRSHIISNIQFAQFL